MINILWGIMGMTVVLALAILFSVDRRKIKIRTVAIALAIQVFFAVFVLYLPWGQTALGWVTQVVQSVINVSDEGISFLFGGLVEGDAVPFALSVLPVIIFFASLTAVLYHLKVLQFVVRVIGGALQKLLGTSRAESMNAAANIFVGQTEAPLVIRPYIAGMTKSELFAVMVGGLSTVAGSVLVGYAGMGANLEYLIAASFMAAPGALLMAKIIIPAGSFDEIDAAKAERQAGDEAALGGGRYTKDHRTAEAGTTSTATATLTEERRADDGATTGADDGAAPADQGSELRPGQSVAEAAAAVEEEERPRNVIDAAARGAGDGLRLAANVGAMLLAFIALIALINLGIGQIGGLFGAPDLTFEQIMGYVFAPLMWAVGVPWEEAVAAGSFLGQKLVLNEFVAFADFAPQAEGFSVKSQAVITFALTGFANFSSMAILLGGLGGIAKNRRSDIAQLGLRAVLAGTLANLMSASIVGMLLF
ncbi:NupC/NupG family nucleoside CNT transporter [Nesterenkonia sp. HG001]|uniref:NupC/NupG family nucleoside CNT transporter n=1 Tax=Nesterenkonia sp. HG001 TaxID=2983207 RepID=UPI002AC50E02|nr:NupC/NupG family nucleoside CNT transporter [Nesterenkonia sp. HG001]MDZ5078114.1 NupC/NupG family nucleoside CNT transporter [Nesterenkonia sp. HG001]